MRILTTTGYTGYNSGWAGAPVGQRSRGPETRPERSWQPELESSPLDLIKIEAISATQAPSQRSDRLQYAELATNDRTAAAGPAPKTPEHLIWILAGQKEELRPFTLEGFAQLQERLAAKDLDTAREVVLSNRPNLWDGERANPLEREHWLQMQQQAANLLENDPTLAQQAAKLEFLVFQANWP